MTMLRKGKIVSTFGLLCIPVSIAYIAAKTLKRREEKNLDEQQEVDESEQDCKNPKHVWVKGIERSANPEGEEYFYSVYKRDTDGEMKSCKHLQDMTIEFIYGNQLAEALGEKLENCFQKLNRVAKVHITEATHFVIPNIKYEKSTDQEYDRMFSLKINGKDRYFGYVDQNFDFEKMVLPGVLKCVEKYVLGM